MTLTWGAATDVGKVRRLNEDAHLEKFGAFVVADGMGGHKAGDVASRLVIEAIDALTSNATPDVSSIEGVVTKANESVRAYANAAGSDAMGSTLVGLFVVNNADQESLVVVNVGDSRCYTLIDGVLTQITKDHSHVQDLVDSGVITADEAAFHRDRNVVTRAIGIEDLVAGDFFVLPSSAGIRVLLCSDGVSGELSSSRISELLSASPQPADAAKALIRAVLEGRAGDNATAVVVDARRVQLIGEDLASGTDVTGPRPRRGIDDPDITAPSPRVVLGPSEMITTVPALTAKKTSASSRVTNTIVLIGDVPI